MKQWGTIGLAMQLAWTLLFSLLLPLLAGIWLDHEFGTTPLFVLIGTVLGILAATVGMVLMVMRMFPWARHGHLDQPAEENGKEEP